MMSKNRYKSATLVTISILVISELSKTKLGNNLGLIMGYIGFISIVLTLVFGILWITSSKSRETIPTELAGHTSATQAKSDHVAGIENAKAYRIASLRILTLITLLMTLWWGSSAVSENSLDVGFAVIFFAPTFLIILIRSIYLGRKLIIQARLQGGYIDEIILHLILIGVCILISGIVASSI